MPENKTPTVAAMEVARKLHGAVALCPGPGCADCPVIALAHDICAAE